MRPWTLILLALAPHAVSGQATWTLTAERGWTTYSAAAHDSSADPTELRAFRPALYTLRLARESGRFSLALGAGIAFGEWGVSIGDFVVLPDESLQLIEIAPEFGIKVATTSTGSTLRLHAGPVLDFWKPSGEDVRQRLGAQVGASVSIPVGAGWAADLRGDVALSRSLMNEDEETGGISRESSMRRGRLALGITRRL